jgi:hypothetical protein
MSATTLTLTIEPGVLDVCSSWTEFDSLAVAMSREIPLRALEETLGDAQERLIDSSPASTPSAPASLAWADPSWAPASSNASCANSTPAPTSAAAAGASPGCAIYLPCTPHGCYTSSSGRSSNGPPTGPAPSHSACKKVQRLTTLPTRSGADAHASTGVTLPHSEHPWLRLAAAPNSTIDRACHRRQARIAQRISFAMVTDSS